MTFKKIIMFISIIALIGGTAFAGGGSEKKPGEWPEKEITIVYHSKAGSGGDIMLRNFAKPLEKELGVPIIIDNRTGASGLNAWGSVKKDAPDGYTFLCISSTFIASPLVSNMDIHPNDFDAVAMMFIDPLIIYTRPDAWKNFDDFLSDVKKNPGKYKIAGGTPGSIDFTVLRMFTKETGLKITEVPFEGGGEATVAVAGGHLDIGLGEYAEVMPLVEGNKLKVLVALNEVPGVKVKTFKDYGYKVDVDKYRGMVAPKGTPEKIVKKFAAAIKKAYDSPEIINYYKTNNLLPYFKSPEETQKLLVKQREQLQAEMK